MSSRSFTQRTIVAAMLCVLCSALVGQRVGAQPRRGPPLPTTQTGPTIKQDTVPGFNVEGTDHRLQRSIVEPEMALGKYERGTSEQRFVRWTLVHSPSPPPLGKVLFSMGQPLGHRESAVQSQAVEHGSGTTPGASSTTPSPLATARRARLPDTGLVPSDGDRNDLHARSQGLVAAW